MSPPDDLDRLSPAQLRDRFPALDTGRHYPPKALSDDAFWADADGEGGALWSPLLRDQFSLAGAFALGHDPFGTNRTEFLAARSTDLDKWQLGSATLGNYMVTTADLSKVLFRDLLLPFEVTSVLILVAVLGAVVLARKEH